MITNSNIKNNTSQHKFIITKHHKQLQLQLKQAICFLQHYSYLIDLIIFTNTNIKITYFPPFIYALANNLLTNCKLNKEAEAYYILCNNSDVYYSTLHILNTNDLKRENFSTNKYAYYIDNAGALVQLKPINIIPLNTCNDCMDMNMFKLQKKQILAYIYLFTNIINLSEIYILNI